MKRTITVLTMAASLVLTMIGGVAVAQDAGITSPSSGEVVYDDMLHLEAHDYSASVTNDLDETVYNAVNWAVRYDTCSVDSSANRAGNVGGFDDQSTWENGEFSSSVDISTWEPGRYCFAFNTTVGDAAGNRLTQEFYIADGRVTGGGQILDGDYKVSFGLGAFAIEDTAGSNVDGVGSVTIRFHNVSVDAIDRTTFTGDGVRDMNFASNGSVTRVSVDGELDGEPGYYVIVRAEDAGEPNESDNIRIELFGPDGSIVYDTSADTDGDFAFGDFSDESNNVGTQRTGVDRGNLQIDTR